MGPKHLRVLTSCKSILCYRSSYGIPTSYYICNPLTRTWITLPPGPKTLPPRPKTRLRPYYHLRTERELKFYGLAFDSATRTCILVIGEKNPIDEENIIMEMQIYDSHTNEWTPIKMNLSNPNFSSREGIYSEGSLYWVNATHDEDSAVLSFHLVAFNVAKRNWSIIQLPSRPDVGSEKRPYWNLTGYDGNVFVAYKKDLSLWKLNKEDDQEERYSWSELQLFPSLAEEYTGRLDGHSPRNLSRTQVVVNSCGWILVYMYGYKMVVFDAQGIMVFCIQGELLKFFGHIGLSWNAHGYEINNIWWP